jgi:cytochrome c553
MTWKYFGPEDSRKEDTTVGWTSQKNQDNVTLFFDMDDGSKDAWRWSLAYTAPFDMALNLNANSNYKLEEFDIPAVRNSVTEGSRAGPQYVWNGIRQEITGQDGSIKLLDPAYYLLDEYKTEYIGDVANGQHVYNNVADCKFCHGINGDGETEVGNPSGSLDSEFTNKYTSKGLVEYISSVDHEGSFSQYFGKIENNETQVENLIAFLRGIAGTPGYVLMEPEEKEIFAVTNISVGGIDRRNSKYQVLFKRKLDSNSTDDISFSPDKIYTLSIQFSDNDEINYVGASGIELVFKSNKL